MKLGRRDRHSGKTDDNTGAFPTNSHCQHEQFLFPQRFFPEIILRVNKSLIEAFESIFFCLPSSPISRQRESHFSTPLFLRGGERESVTRKGRSPPRRSSWEPAPKPAAATTCCSRLRKQGALALEGRKNVFGRFRNRMRDPAMAFPRTCRIINREWIFSYLRHVYVAPFPTDVVRNHKPVRK